MKKRLRKLTALAIAVCMFISITACGSKEETTETASVTSTSSEVKAESVVETKSKTEDESVEEEVVETITVDPEIVEKFESIKDTLIDDYRRCLCAIKDPSEFKEAMKKAAMGADEKTPDGYICSCIREGIYYALGGPENDQSAITDMGRILDYLQSDEALDSFTEELVAARKVYESDADNLFYGWLFSEKTRLTNAGENTSVYKENVDYMSQVVSVLARVADETLDETEPYELYDNEKMTFYYYSQSLVGGIKEKINYYCGVIVPAEQENANAIYTEIREKHLEDPTEIWKVLFSE